MTISASPWWAPHVHADRRPFLLARGRIRDAVRAYFAKEGFVEVECGALAVSPGNEAHLHAFATERVWPDGRRSPLYLHTSPEFACKKLLAAGERKIFSLGPVFRNREQGALNAPEFAMLEWYRAEEPISAVIEDCVHLVRLAADAGSAETFCFRGRTADPRARASRITVAEAFRDFAGIDLLATLGAEGGARRDALAEHASRARVTHVANDSWSDIFSRVLVEKIEPKLGLGHPTFLDEYPRIEAALARASVRDPRLAERFELYLCGVEIANGFGELTDALEQRRRFAEEMAEKERVYGERYPIDEDFLEALSSMPQACGVALGFDRLVMLAAGAERLSQVIWTPAPDGDA